MTRLRIAMLVWMTAGVQACASTHKIIAARRTPCDYDEIEVSEEVFEAGEERWLAVCGQRRYRCRSKAVGNRVLYSCRSENARPAPQR